MFDYLILVDLFYILSFLPLKLIKKINLNTEKKQLKLKFKLDKNL